MNCGVIDVGSNTIRAVVYQVRGQEFHPLASRKEFSGILGDTESGRLSDTGLDRLCSVLSKMAAFCRAANCSETACFATASLRGIENAGQVCRTVKERCQIELRLLSGEEEADCDLTGLLLEIPDRDGIGADLGGGSCQLYQFRDREKTASVSIEAGCLRLNRMFVAGIFPTAQEREAISEYVQKELSSHQEWRQAGFPVLYLTGGSARAAAKLQRARYGLEGHTDGHGRPVSRMPVSRMPVYRMPVSRLEELAALAEVPGAGGVHLIQETIPERISTILPALAAMKIICGFVGAEEIQIVNNGVREGYLWKNIISRQNGKGRLS